MGYEYGERVVEVLTKIKALGIFRAEWVSKSRVDELVTEGKIAVRDVRDWVLCEDGKVRKVIVRREYVWK